MYDTASYTGSSCQKKNTPALRYDAQADPFALALCGGGIGTPFAARFSDSLLKKLKSEDTADAAIRALSVERAGDLSPHYCALKICNTSCGFSAFGSIRLFGFLNGAFRLLNADESKESAGTFRLTDGDALLVCSEPFWENVGELEMEIDYLKSESAQDWLDAMMIRLMSRRPLDEDSLAAFTLIYHEETRRENENGL